MSKYPVGTLNIAAVQDALYDWIKEVTKGVLTDGGEIIWRNQSEPLPPRPCVTLKLIDGPRPIARNGSLFFNTKRAPFTVGIQMEATLSIQVFGNTRVHRPVANQLLLDINSSLLRQSVLDDLKMAGIAIQGVGSPRNLTAIEETEYEERAGMDISLGLAQNVSDKPGVIETIDVEINTDAGTEQKTINLP